MTRLPIDASICSKPNEYVVPATTVTSYEIPPPAAVEAVDHVLRIAFTPNAVVVVGFVIAATPDVPGIDV
jgi:hypothetical protein